MTIHTIGEICNINALSIRKGEHPKQILYLDTANLVEGRICKLQEINFADAPSRAQRKINNDTILYSSVRPNLKHFGIMKSMPSNVIVSTGFITLDVKDKSLFSPEYIYYLLTQQGVVDYLQGIAQNGVSAYPSINPSDIANLKFNFPSLSDQEHIASVLTNIDRKIALNRQINDNLEAMARQLYDYWFVQFDFPDENGRPYKSSGGKMVWNEKLKREMPEGWKICPLSELLKINDARRIPLSNKQRAERQCIYPYYGATGIMDYVDDFLFDEDLLLLAEDGSTSDGKGHPIVQYIWGKNWVNNHAHILKPKYAGQLYYYYFVLKQIPVALIETGSIQKKISQQNLLSYRVAVSPENLIQAFSNVANVLQEQRKKNFDAIDCLTKQRDALLPLLTNGQATVNYHLSDD